MIPVKIAPIILLSLYLVACSQASVRPHSVPVVQIPASDELDGQQVLTLKQSSRARASFIADFMASAGTGIITLNTDRDVQFNLIINGRAVADAFKLSTNLPLAINISNLTITGANFIKLTRLSDPDAVISAHIPFPELEDSSTKSGADFTRVDDLIETDIANGFPGAVLAVIKDSKLIKHQAYGYAQRYQSDGTALSKPEPMTTDILFDLASNTKMYATNFALMKLVSEGKLDVNRPIQTYIPEYQGQGRELRQVKDLLTHTAGYEPSTPFYDRKRSESRGLFSQDAQKTRKLLASQLGFKTARNHKSIYSDNDYLLLGLIVERITGQSLDDYVEQQIYQPMALMNTIFNPLLKGFRIEQTAATELAGNSRGGRIRFENIRTDVVRGQVHDEKAFYSMAGIAGHAGLFSTAEEIARLAMVVLNRGGYGNHTIFDAGVMDQFLKPSDLDITTGLGWRRAGDADRTWQFGPYASPYAVGHTGWTGTVTVIDPAYNLVIVLLTNKKHTPIIDTDKGPRFIGDQFETGKYGSVVALIYEAVLNLSP